jgi:type VI protein secretion system component VasF
LCYSEQLVRQLDEQIENEKRVAPPDIVEQLKARARRNPLTAWLIIVFLILALLIPLLNSLWELLGKIMSFFPNK